MRRRSLLPSFLLAALLAGPVSAANIVIVNSDPAGTGLNDPAPVAPVGGNAGTTLGQQRLIVFQQAAAIWGGLLTSTVTIRVSASFTPLDCTATTAVLGSTRANTVYSDFAGAPVAGTWYAKSLANKLAGSDLDGATFDMTAQFNSNLGQTGCFTGSPFYLGLDNLHGSKPNFLTVALHEFAHGLGFFSLVTSSGAFQGGQPAIFDRFIYDDTLGQTWDKLTSAQRATSQVNTGNLTWSGTAANAFAASYLGKKERLLVTTPAAAAGLYSVGTATFGPALSNPGVTGQIVAATMFGRRRLDHGWLQRDHERVERLRQDRAHRPRNVQFHGQGQERPERGRDRRRHRGQHRRGPPRNVRHGPHDHDPVRPRDHE